MSTGDPRYLKLLEDMKTLHINKNSGYSGDSPDRWANFRMAESFGVSAFLGCLVRMSDKFIRIQNLVKNPKNEKVGESIKDTLLDLSSYALIAYCLLEEQEELKPKVEQEEPILTYFVRITNKNLPDTCWYAPQNDEGNHFWVEPDYLDPGSYFQLVTDQSKKINIMDCEIVNE